MLFDRDYENLLIAALLSDVEFTNLIVDKLNSTDFTTDNTRMYYHIIKHNLIKKNVFVNYERLIDELKFETNGEAVMVLVDILEMDIKPYLGRDLKVIKDTCNKFVTRKRQSEWLKLCQRKLDNGFALNENEITSLEETMKIEIEDEWTDFCDADVVKDTLTKEVIEFIPTGIVGLDPVLRGGIRKGTYGLLLAYSGIGKSTMLTYIASNAFLSGFNVMHMVWEDKRRDVHKKWLTHRYNVKKGYDENNGVNSYEIEEHYSHEDFIKEKEPRNKYFMIGIKKDVTTLKNVENNIKNYIKNYGHLDLLVLDYADLLSYSPTGDEDEYKKDGKIHRGIERLAEKYNIAIWTASQINRNGSNAGSVDSGNVGGSIKKIQTAPLIIGLNKSQEQKQFGCATVNIIKNRTGHDGFEFKDVIFNNGKMIIDLTETIDCTGFEN